MSATLLDGGVKTKTRTPERAAAVRSVRVGLLGLGRVGQAVADLAWAQREAFRSRGLELRVECALVRDAHRPRGEAARAIPKVVTPGEFLHRSYDVVIEVLGGVQPARTLVTRVLETGTPVVTANKSLLAAHGDELRRVPAEHGTAVRCEASALAGVPFLGALERRPCAASVERLSGILNGTSNYILSLIDKDGAPFAEALRRAQELGYAEPDAGNDVRGIDAAEKLAVILQHIGAKGVETKQLEVRGIERIEGHDLAAARKLGGTIKPIAHAAIGANGIEAFVGPAFVPEEHPLARVQHERNALCFEGKLTGSLFYCGPGAGPAVTAAAILDDVVEIVAEGTKESREQGIEGRKGRRVGGEGSADGARTCRAPQTPWFVRFRFAGQAPNEGELCELLGSHGIWFRRLSELRQDEGQALYGITQTCARERLERGLAAVRAASGCETLEIRVLEE